MQIEQFFGFVAGLACLGFGIYLPVRFFMLIGQVKRLEQEVSLLTRDPSAKRVQPAKQVQPATLVQPVAQVQPATEVVSTASPAAPTPPPLPAKPTPAPAPIQPVVVQPDPLFERLRDLGLLPPADLKGEYALGAWWAVRVGGVLAVAAVVFLGIWLNLRSTIPPIVRVLEVALVGAGLFWGGLRLSVKRADLGQVVAASGLGVWQFAAWATYGLDRMRVCDSAATAALIQFVVACLVGAVALRKGSKLFGQLAVVFATVAVYFSIGAGAAPGPTAAGACLVALLGVILTVRGPWGSAGLLGLLGSQISLLLLYDAMPNKDANYLPLQLAALGSYLVLWFGERNVKDDAVLFGGDARATFQLASFFCPAFIALFLARGETERATVSLLIAAVANVAGYCELRRRPLVCEILLLSAVGFVGAGLAWLVDPHLVWLIWALAASATLLVASRTRSELVRWSSESLALVSIFAFVDHPPATAWISLAGLASFGLLLAFREDWECVSDRQKFRRIIGILGLSFAVLAVQAGLPKADTGWPWIMLLLVAAVRFRPALLWAATPAYVLTALFAVFWRPIVGSEPAGWAIFWCVLVSLGNLFAFGRLIGRDGEPSKILRGLLAFTTAIVLFAFAHHVVGFLLPQGPAGGTSAAWALTLLWSGGGALLVGLTVGSRRYEVIPADLSLVALGGLVGFFIQGMVAEGAGLRQIGLVHAPFVLLGLGCLLYVLAVHTREQEAWGSLQRIIVGAGALFLVSFVMLSRLPGAGVSLFWALASVLTFVIGHLFPTRALRMLGLVGLGVATLRVISHDITDMLGRIAACAAVAVAFFGIAWLYGRITAEKKDA